MRTLLLLLALLLSLGACTQPAPQASDPAPPASNPEPAAAEPAAPEADESVKSGIELSGNDWILREFDGEPLAPELSAAISEPITLRIDQQHIDDAAAKLSGFDGCNRLFASADLSEGQMRIGQIGASKMYCQATSDFAQRYHQQLRQVTGYAIGGSELYLLDADGGALLVYRLP